MCKFYKDEIEIIKNEIKQKMFKKAVEIDDYSK